MIKNRQIIAKIEHKLLNTPNIIVITGARQVGKTSIMQYLKNKYSQKYHHNVLYLDLEDELLLSELENLANSEYPHYFKNKGLMIDRPGLVFIDEIQYLDRPTKVLKYLHDRYKHLRLIVSGFSSLEINKKIKETLTGRKSVFQVQPLNWQEFLEFKEAKIAPGFKSINLKAFFNDEIKPSDLVGLEKETSFLWEEFLLYGGYPKVVLTNGFDDKQDELKEIYNSYVKKDIKDMADIQEVGKFNKLVQLLSWQIGNLVVAGELSSSTDLNIVTCNKYLDILEHTFVIKLIRPFYSNKRVEIIKSPKIFFADTGLRNSITGNYAAIGQRSDIGALIENYVFSELSKYRELLELKYWRKKVSGLEVGFILENQFGQELLPIEVKFKNFSQPAITRSFHSFFDNYKARKAVIINRNLFAKIQVNTTQVYFIPVWMLG